MVGSLEMGYLRGLREDVQVDVRVEGLQDVRVQVLADLVMQ